ncbi:hypothetical protein MTYP_02001 [Methylophilaceae bacterium]|nr:hypothetical protein MTYP_02001 [Methylophilaceae bacterium]
MQDAFGVIPVLLMSPVPAVALFRGCGHGLRVCFLVNLAPGAETSGILPAAEVKGTLAEFGVVVPVYLEFRLPQLYIMRRREQRKSIIDGSLAGL